MLRAGGGRKDLLLYRLVRRLCEGSDRCVKLLDYSLALAFLSFFEMSKKHRFCLSMGTVISLIQTEKREQFKTFFFNLVYGKYNQSLSFTSLNWNVVFFFSEKTIMSYVPRLLICLSDTCIKYVEWKTKIYLPVMLMHFIYKQYTYRM